MSQIDSPAGNSTGGSAPAPKLPAKRGWGWKSWLLAAVIFFGGMTCGAGLTVVTAIHKIRFVIQHPDAARAGLEAHLTRRLGLSVDQSAKVDEIFRRHQSALLEIRRSVHPRLEEELDGMERDVSAILNADQRMRWEQMFGEARRNWLPSFPTTRQADGG